MAVDRAKTQRSVYVAVLATPLIALTGLVACDSNDTPPSQGSKPTQIGTGTEAEDVDPGSELVPEAIKRPPGVREIGMLWENADLAKGQVLAIQRHGNVLICWTWLGVRFVSETDGTLLHGGGRHQPVLPALGSDGDVVAGELLDGSLLTIDTKGPKVVRKLEPLDLPVQWRQSAAISWFSVNGCLVGVHVTGEVRAWTMAGQPLWQLELPHPSVVAPFFDGGELLFVTSQSLIAVDIDSGNLRNRTQVFREAQERSEQTYLARGVVVDDVFYGCAKNAVFAIQLSEKAPLWERHVSEGVYGFQPICGTRDAVFIQSTTSLYRLETRNGNVKWRVLTGGDTGQASPFLFGGKVWSVARIVPGRSLQEGESAITAFDIRSGKPTHLLWRSGLASSFVVQEQSVVYVGFANGWVAAIDEQQIK